MPYYFKIYYDVPTTPGVEGGGGVTSISKWLRRATQLTRDKTQKSRLMTEKEIEKSRKLRCRELSRILKGISKIDSQN